VIGVSNNPCNLYNNGIKSLDIHTALIFKEQEKLNDKGLRENGLAQPHYSIQHTEKYDLIFCDDNKQNLYSSIVDTSNKEYCPGIMNIDFIQDRQKQKRLSGIP
jgi:hypothetical protein